MQATTKIDDRVFKALANADRRRILDLLKDGAKTTGELCRALSKLDRCTVLQHIKALEHARLVIRKKRGRECWNYLDVAPIQRVYNRWISDYCAPTAGLLARLQADVEGHPV